MYRSIVALEFSAGENHPHGNRRLALSACAGREGPSPKAWEAVVVLPSGRGHSHFVGKMNATRAFGCICLILLT